MALNHAINALLTTLILFSGCIGGDAPTSETPTDEGTAAADADAASDQQSSPATPVEPVCDLNTNNYGIHVGLGEYYIHSRDGAAFARVYDESNGITGLQTVDACPENHDAIVAEIPDPLAAVAASASAESGAESGSADSAAKCSRPNNSISFTQWGDTRGEHYLAGPWGNDYLLVLYDETNGVKDLQAKGYCAKPDREVASVPAPLLFGPASVSLNA